MLLRILVLIIKQNILLLYTKWCYNSVFLSGMKTNGMEVMEGTFGMRELIFFFIIPWPHGGFEIIGKLLTTSVVENLRAWYVVVERVSSGANLSSAP